MGMRHLVIAIGCWMATLSAVAQGYPVPQVPDSITEPQARCDYATQRYWDHFDFSDTTLLRTDYGEQALVDFLWLLQHASDDGKNHAVRLFRNHLKEHTAAYRYFVGKARNYLTNPDSPVYALIPLEDIMGTRIGDVATDFAYQTADGQRHLLSETATDRMTLLLFYDPDCDNCRTMIAHLRNDAVINKQLAKGRLSVFAVYTEEDRDRWRTTLSSMPTNWLVATSSEPPLDNLYDLTVMPALYLLDAHKTIILKDNLTAIRQWLKD